MTDLEYNRQVQEIKTILKIKDENHIKSIMIRRINKEIEEKSKAYNVKESEG